MGGFFYWRYLEADPVVSIPTPVMPAHNAYDDFVQASVAVKDPDNLLYQFGRDYRAGAKIIPGPLPKSFPDRDITAKPTANLYWQKELDAAIAANAPAMTILRGSAGYSCATPPARSFSQLYPKSIKFRSFARMANGYGCMLESRGEYAKAMECYQDTMRMGVELTHGSTTLGVYVGISLPALVQKDAWGCVINLTAPEARDAASRMEAINRRILPLADVLLEEKIAVQASLMEVFSQPDWRKAVCYAGYGEDQLPQDYKIYTVGKRTIMAHYTRCIDSHISIAKHPYGARKRLPRPEAGDVISERLMPRIGLISNSISRFQTQGHLLATALALRAYRLEHGAYPAALGDLVAGKYLTAIPEDPFANKAPLQYKRVGTNYVLYSIGPDSKDDGGKPSVDGKMGSNKGYVDRDSTGDIVAGVNVM